MKKKLVSALMCATMAVTMLAGCGNGSKNGTEAADGGTEAAEAKVVTNTLMEIQREHTLRCGHSLNSMHSTTAQW